ncbi:MAG: glycosyltransferase family 4 protein [Proteobacteria bacterium]|nr:glycosyltransferase family 4 protein [Pseudomonadota bacterium]
MARGGADLHVRELDAALQRRGHDVRLVALGGAGPDAIGTEGAPGSRFRRSFANADLCARFAALMVENTPDVVHFHSLRGLHYAMPGIARLAGARTVWTHHDLWVLCQRVHLRTGLGSDCDGPRRGVACGPCHGGLARLLGGLMFPLRTTALRRAADDCDANIAPSAWVAQELMEHGIDQDSVHVLPPAVARPMRDAVEPRVGRARLVFAGDLRQEKGADLAVAAAAELETRVELDVHGGSPAAPASPDRPYEARLMSRAGASPIRFHGRYEPPMLSGLLDGATALIAPSRVRESFGRTVNAALLSGVPVVVADHGGLAEQVIEGVNGTLFPPGDAEGLQHAIERLLEQRRDLVDRRAAWPLTPDLERHVEGLLALYGAAA